MRRKAGGLAALMTGQPVVKKKKSKKQMFRKIFKAAGLHIFLVCFCVFYVFLGALVFRYLEADHEENVRLRTETVYHKLAAEFMEKTDMLTETIEDDIILNSSLTALVDQHIQQLFQLYKDPIAANYFDNLVYRKGNYQELWSFDAAVLLTSTTMVPVGFGLITPLTLHGRLFLVIYALIGIPLALVTMSDLGRFFCDGVFKLVKENMTAMTVSLLTMLVLYPLLGGIWIHLVSTMTLFDAIYYCCITILTVGFGDIDPPIAIPGLVLFIVVGVTLVTASIDVVAANAIHHVHYMGRQMGKAREAAAKMIQMAQKININRGLGIGMAQLGAFARMGMLIQITPGNPQETTSTLIDISSEPPRSAGVFDPEMEFDLIDRGGGNFIQMEAFEWLD